MKTELLNSLVPLIGVLVGWFLREVSQTLKDRQERMKLINRSFYTLLDLIFILEQKKALLFEGQKLNNNITADQYNIIAVLFNDRKYSSEKFRSRVDGAIDKLSEIDPVMCQQLKLFSDESGIFDNLELNVSGNFSSEIQNQYKILNLFSSQLNRLIIRLLLYYNCLMLLRYLIFRKKNFSENNSVWKDILSSH